MGPRFLFSSLRARFILLVLLAILPALVIMLYTAFETRQHEIAKTREDVLTLTQLVASREEQLIEGVHQLLITLAELPEVRSDDPAACTERLISLLNLYPDYRGFGVARLDGNVFCSTASSTPPVNAASRPWFQRAIQTHSFAVGDYQVGRTSGQGILVFSYPVFDAANQPQAVAFAVKGVGALGPAAEMLLSKPGTALMVIDRHGTILNHYPEPEKWIGQTLPETPLIQTILSQEQGEVELPGVDGITRLYTFTPLRSVVETGLYLAAGISKEIAFAEADQVWRRNITLLGLVGLLALAAAWFGSDIFVLRWIRRLVEVADRLREGDLSTRAGMTSRVSELNHLAHAFNEMATSLEQRETERKRTELGQRLLAKTGEVLASSLDYKTRLTNVAQLAVPELADWCSVDIIEEDSSFRRLAITHVDPAKRELAYQLQHRYPPDWNAPQGAGQVMRTGQPELYPEITDEMLVAAARDAEMLHILRDLQMKSAMVVPLTARGRTLGAITFVWAESNRRYDAADLALAEELGRRAGLAVDNASLYQNSQKARQAAEEAAERIARLQTITAALSRALTPAQVTQVIIDQGLATASGADGGAIALLNEAGDQFEVVASFGYSADLIETWRHFPFTPTRAPISDAVHTGEPLFIGSQELLLVRYPELRGLNISNHQAWAVLPLKVEERSIGAISLTFIEANIFSQEDRTFLLALTRQCAQALERARLYEVERVARAEAETAQQRLALLAEARERNRLAQELHDTVAQALAYLNMKITLTNTLLSTGKIDEAQANLRELKTVVGEAYTDVREEIFNMRANTYAGLGFLELLDKYIDKYHRFYNLDIQLVKEADPVFFEFPGEVTPQLIRTIQEALINIRKHAKVNQAIIRLSRADHQVRISIEDQGYGFDLAQVREKTTSFGLQIMRERVESVGGNLEIDTAPGAGTRVILYYTNGKHTT
jgi:signal transduction histidine kinase/HAMP domain-containing protein